MTRLTAAEYRLTGGRGWPGDNADERTHQVAVIRARDVALAEYPELALLYAIPNGGHRHKAVAAKLQAEGVARGVPDLHLPLPAGRCPGLWLEMKRPTGGMVRKEQAEWLHRLGQLGHRVEVCKSAAYAWAVLMEYVEEHRRALR